MLDKNPLDGFTPEQRDTVLERLAAIVELDRPCATRADHEILMTLLKTLLCRWYDSSLSTMAQLEILLESLPCEGDDTDPDDMCCKARKAGRFSSKKDYGFIRDPAYTLTNKNDYDFDINYKAFSDTCCKEESVEEECGPDVCKKEQTVPLSSATLPELVEELTRRVSGS